MNTTTGIQGSAMATAVAEKWNNSPFFAPDTVVLGLDIGIEGIGITVRRGQEWIYSKTLLVDLPEAQALAERRAFRAARHARKNRRTRMRRLKELFARHNLPWVSDDVMSRSDPFKLRYRAITGKLPPARLYPSVSAPVFSAAGTTIWPCPTQRKEENSPRALTAR